MATCRRDTVPAYQRDNILACLLVSPHDNRMCSIYIYIETPRQHNTMSVHRRPSQPEQVSLTACHHVSERTSVTACLQLT